MPVPTRRYDLLRPRIDRFTKMLPGVADGDVRAIHRARVATRRLRELLPILQLDGGTAAKLGRRLRKSTRGLGVARELDVLQLLVDELQESGRQDRRALRLVADDIRQARDEVRKTIGGKTLAAQLRRAGRRLQNVAADLETAEEGRAASRALRWALDARVARRAAALQKAVRDVGAVYLSERLHEVRIALKKLRYAVELSVEAGGSIPTADLRALKRWQELLGRLRDLQVLIDRVRKVQVLLRPPDLAAWRDLDALVMSLEQSCRRLHARYVREREAIAAICDRLGGRPSAGVRSATRRAG